MTLNECTKKWENRGIDMFASGEKTHTHTQKKLSTTKSEDPRGKNISST